jgi:hypothetical protein
MNLQTQAELAFPAGPSAGSETKMDAPSPDSLQQSAALEFHATLQLLAERARFLTGAVGVAIALEQDQQIVYTAATGSLVQEIGAIAEVAKYPPRVWVTAGEIRYAIAEREGKGKEGPNPDLAVAVLKDSKLVGFLELAPGPHQFEDADLETAARLADMVGTALDLLDAAAPAASPVPAAPSAAPAVRVGPILWHAPEQAAPVPPTASASLPPAPADVHTCTGCGFPVSGARTKCVDCDSRWDEQPPAPVPLSELFRVEKEESWIEAHGYTIATALVSALTAAILYWLR